MNRGSVLARKQRQKKIRRLLSAAVVICALVAIALIKILSTPAQGAVVQNSSMPRNPVQNDALPTQSAPVIGRYIKFSYQDNYRTVPSAKLVDPQLETFDFVTKHSPFRELALSVSQLPSGNLKDDGSYNMRSRNPDRYSLEMLEINGRSVPVFTDKQEPYSKAAFISHNAMLLSVALSGQGDSERMQAEQMDIIKSVEWLR